MADGDSPYHLEVQQPGKWMSSSVQPQQERRNTVPVARFDALQQQQVQLAMLVLELSSCLHVASVCARGYARANVRVGS